MSDDYLKNLTEEQKKALFEAKTPEDLKGMVDGDDKALSDVELDKVAGGCFRPTAYNPHKTDPGRTCPTCGMPATDGGKTCIYCGDPIPDEDPDDPFKASPGGRIL